MMNASSELILFAVNLAVNLLLFGLIIAGSIIVSLQLIKNISPRLSYVIAVLAFFLAVLLPLFVTVNGSFGLEKFIGAEQKIVELPASQTSAQTQEVVFFTPNEAAKEKYIERLNGFTVAVADSFVGIAFLSLWIAVAFCILLREVVAHRRLKKSRQGWREATDEECNELAFFAKSALYFGEESPVTIGYFNPVIVLPHHFPDDLPLASKRMIIQHELAHARWRDPLVNCLLRLIRGLFWISPALWLLERTAVAEREFAADFSAIKSCAAEKSEFEAVALNYATTLLSAARHFNSNPQFRDSTSQTVGINNGNFIENRVRRLLDYSSKTSYFGVFLMAAIFAGNLAVLQFLPVAFQPERVISQVSEEITSNENLREAPVSNKPIEVPQVIEKNYLQEKKNRAVYSKRTERMQERPLTKERRLDQIPKVILKTPQQPLTLSLTPVDKSGANSTKGSAEKVVEEGGLNRKINELNLKVKELDAQRKNIRSGNP